jgi:hypothetical protein
MPRLPAKCGTTGGYQRHRRRGEKSCEDCKLAWSAYGREYAASRRPERPEHGTAVSYRGGCRCDACLGWHIERYERTGQARADAIRDEAEWAAQAS